MTSSERAVAREIVTVRDLSVSARVDGAVVDIVRGVAGSNAFQGGPPAARNNILELVAAQHARVMFPQNYT